MSYTNNVKKLFCYNPWTSTQVNSSASISFCPAAIKRNSDIKLNQKYLLNANEILNHPQYTEVRKKLLSGIFPEECKNCEFVEKNNGRSFRNAISEGLTKYIDKDLLIQNTDDNGYLKKPEIKYIELRLGRICNLRCRFCGPVNSSAWDRDYKKLYADSHSYESVNSEHNQANNDDWYESDWFFIWFDSIIESVETIQFAGGEPLLSPSHLKILNKLIENKTSFKINLVYVTNGTILDHKLFTTWSMFKSVHVFVSIEGIGKNYEYQRWPAKWLNTEQNINHLSEQIGKSISKMTIQPHLNIFNVMNISDLAIWFLQQSQLLNWNKQLNFLTEPKWISAFILTYEQKKLAADKIHMAIIEINNKFPESQRKSDVVWWLKSASAAISEQDWSALQSESKILNTKLDKIRGCKSSDFLDDITNSFVCDQN